MALLLVLISSLSPETLHDQANHEFKHFFLDQNYDDDAHDHGIETCSSAHSVIRLINA